mgnify:CR=1 FL=1
MDLNTTSEIISFAKKLEEDSAKFYEDLSHRYAQDEDVFLSFVKENRKNAVQIERAYYGVISDALEGCFSFKINPDEYMLKGYELEIVNIARKKLIKSPPPNIDLSDFYRLSEYVSREAMKCVREASIETSAELMEEDVERLSKIVVTYTSGLGIIECIMSDNNITDLYINSPVEENPLYIVHSDYGEMKTNIFLKSDDIEAIISRFRARSGRAFSEAVPVLDLELPEFGVRVCTIGKPLAPDGVAFAMRRAKSTPWTLLEMIEKRTLNSLSAALLSFFVDGNLTILITGPRGAGKTSLLTSLICELPMDSRIITIEDTLEIPVSKLNLSGFRIQRLKTQSAISRAETEISGEDALRTALRLGDSALVIGEVRGSEAKVLYEAMRIGAAGSCVLGTIHGSSTRDVYERVVHDIGIAPLSFKATDIVVVVAPVRMKGTSRKRRRVIEISEVTKDWGEHVNPNEIFRYLMKYDASKDELKLSKTVLDGNSVAIKKIAEMWGMSYDDALKNIELRAKVFEELLNLKDHVSLDFFIRAKNIMRRILDKESNYNSAFKIWKNEITEKFK